MERHPGRKGKHAREWWEEGEHKEEGWAMRSEGRTGLGRAGKAMVPAWVLSGGRGRGCSRSCGHGRGQAKGRAGDLGTGRGQAGAPPAGALRRNCQGPGKRAERHYMMGHLQILWSDVNFSVKWDEFILNMLQCGLTSETCQMQWPHSV